MGSKSRPLHFLNILCYLYLILRALNMGFMLFYLIIAAYMFCYSCLSGNIILYSFCQTQDGLFMQLPHFTICSWQAVIHDIIRILYVHLTRCITASSGNVRMHKPGWYMGASHMINNLLYSLTILFTDCCRSRPVSDHIFNLHNGDIVRENI